MKIDLVGQRFNQLLVLRETSMRPSSGIIIWECKCDCGKYTNVRASDLITGNTKSCGCLRDEIAIKNLIKQQNEPSKGEQVIAKILTNNHIRFETEKSFNDDKRIARYRFDFYLPDQNACIEFQGMQHMQYSSFFYKKRSDFTKALERDRIKISYCLAHGIILYCIPYWDLDKLYDLSDLFKESYIAHTKFHNDDMWREHQKFIASK